MKSDDITGHLILLTAPSGSGKGTLMRGLGTRAEALYFVKTYTSRERRAGVEENPKYTFISKEEFEQMIEDDAFIEWASFGGNLYGTAKEDVLSALTSGKVAFKEMELQGVLQMKEIVPEDKITVIYIDAGSWEALERRVKARAPITDVELELRKQRYEKEAEWKHSADVVISNQDGELEDAKHAFYKTIDDILKKTA